MIVALKGNREVKITIDEKQHYLDKGFEVVDLDAIKNASKSSNEEVVEAPKKVKRSKVVVEETAE